MSKLTVQRTAIQDVLELIPRQFQDDRGSFAEIYNALEVREAGIDASFVQDNMSFSRQRGTVRGLHFQLPPYAQGKLVRAIDGVIFDVALDLRVGSPHYGQHVSVQLDSQRGNWLYIPAGFAHGFCTLDDNSRVLYKVTSHYVPESDRGIRWDDAKLAIDWPVSADKAQLSEKDRSWPGFDEIAGELPFSLPHRTGQHGGSS